MFFPQSKKKKKTTLHARVWGYFRGVKAAGTSNTL